MQNEPNIPQQPFRVDVADRVKRLPPYLFGKINALKYQKRRAGIDVIDLGMGNPTDVPDPNIVEKLCEAARDERNHRYSVSNGLFNLRREVSLRYERRHGVRLNPDDEIIACDRQYDAGPLRRIGADHQDTPVRPLDECKQVVQPLVQHIFRLDRLG